MYRNTNTKTLADAADALGDFLTHAQLMSHCADFNPDLLAELQHHQRRMEVALEARQVVRRKKVNAHDVRQ